MRNRPRTKTTPEPLNWQGVDMPKSYSTFTFNMGHYPEEEAEEEEHMEDEDYREKVRYISAHQFRRPKKIKEKEVKESKKPQKPKKPKKKKKKVTWIKNRFGFTDQVPTLKLENTLVPDLPKKKKKKAKKPPPKQDEELEEEESDRAELSRRKRRRKQKGSTAVTVSTVRRPIRGNFRPKEEPARRSRTKQRLSSFTRPIRKEDVGEEEEESLRENEEDSRRT